LRRRITILPSALCLREAVHRHGGPVTGGSPRAQPAGDRINGRCPTIAPRIETGLAHLMPSRRCLRGRCRIDVTAVPPACSFCSTEGRHVQLCKSRHPKTSPRGTGSFRPFRSASDYGTAHVHRGRDELRIEVRPVDLLKSFLRSANVGIAKFPLHDVGRGNSSRQMEQVGYYTPTLFECDPTKSVWVSWDDARALLHATSNLAQWLSSRQSDLLREMESIVAAEGRLPRGRAEMRARTPSSAGKTRPSSLMRCREEVLLATHCPRASAQ
jgi:hypothetical protein